MYKYTKQWQYRIILLLQHRTCKKFGVGHEQGDNAKTSHTSVVLVVFSVSPYHLWLRRKVRKDPCCWDPAAAWSQHGSTFCGGQGLLGEMHSALLEICLPIWKSHCSPAVECTFVQFTRCLSNRVNVLLTCIHSFCNFKSSSERWLEGPWCDCYIFTWLSSSSAEWWIIKTLADVSCIFAAASAMFCLSSTLSLLFRLVRAHPPTVALIG